MDEQRNSKCWYVNSCNDKCSNCVTFTSMNWQMKNSGLPEAKQKAISLWLVDDIDKEAFNRLADIRKNIVDFVEQGKSLYICSDYTGNGKTSWAIKMLHTYFHYTAVGNYDNLKGMFVSTTSLLTKLKDFSNNGLISQTYKDRLENVDLVVWDDIAISGISQFDLLQLYSIIDSRTLAEKSNIFTSNIVDPSDLSDMIGERLTSRIYYNSEVIELKGKDMR